MPELQWHEYELLEFFDALLFEAENSVLHRFGTVRNGLQLVFTLKQWESYIEVSLCRENSDERIVNFTAFVRGAIRHNNDDRGNYLEISDCIVVPDRLLYFDLPVYNREKMQFSTTILIEANPDISIRFERFR